MLPRIVSNPSRVIDTLSPPPSPVPPKHARGRRPRFGSPQERDAATHATRPSSVYYRRPRVRICCPPSSIAIGGALLDVSSIIPLIHATIATRPLVHANGIPARLVSSLSYPRPCLSVLWTARKRTPGTHLALVGVFAEPSSPQMHWVAAPLTRTVLEQMLQPRGRPAPEPADDREEQTAGPRLQIDLTRRRAWIGAVITISRNIGTIGVPLISDGWCKRGCNTCAGNWSRTCCNRVMYIPFAGLAIG